MSSDPQQPKHGKPLVSVVVPTCNRQAIFQRCMEALVRQTHPNYEVIIVDDYSTDDTPAFMQRFIAEHPEQDVRYLRNEVHAGANPSRNRGVHEARGEFVAFLDNDCIAEPDWLEHLIASFTSDRVAAVVGMILFMSRPRF